MFWASYWLIINTNGSSLPIPVHLHVCNQWDLSNTDQVATVRRNLLPVSSALACHPMRWEQHGSGGNCQIDLLPASSALYSQPIRCGQQGSGCNFQVTLFLIPCALICHYPIKRLWQGLVAVAIKRWTNHHVLMLDSHCCLWWLYITQPALCTEGFP
jgi:hypothetical protein